MKQFENKVAVITGGASGIGLSLAKSALARGMKVMIADIEAPALEQAVITLSEADGVDEQRLATFVCDVSKSAQVQALCDKTLETFKSINLLCNNAGVGGGGSSWQSTEDYWDWVLGVNLFGVIHGMRIFTPHLIDSGDGHILNTASVAGLMAVPGTGPYGVSKHGVVALSEILAGDLRTAEAPVTVSVLCPSYVGTNIYDSERNRPLTEELKSDKSYFEEREAMAEMAGALFKSDIVVSPDDVAEKCFASIERGGFYVLTHEEASRARISDRFNSILNDKQPPAKGPEDIPI